MHALDAETTLCRANRNLFVFVLVALCLSWIRRVLHIATNDDNSIINTKYDY